MTSEGLGEMFEGESVDMCAGKCPLMLMGGRAEGLCGPGSEDPHRLERNLRQLILLDLEELNKGFLKKCHIRHLEEYK